MSKPAFTELDVAMFWEYASGFSWTEWMALSADERGVVISAHRKLSVPDDEPEEEHIPASMSDDDAPAQERKPAVIESIPGITA